MVVPGGKSNNVVLTGHGFSLRLTAAEGSSPDRFTGQACISVEEDWVDRAISVKSDFPMADLSRLVDWIEVHLRQFWPSGLDLSRSDRRVWVPLDLSLQLELLDGEVEQASDGSLHGSITLSAFVNLGLRKPSGFATYQGVQGVVDAGDLVRFCAEVRGSFIPTGSC